MNPQVEPLKIETFQDIIRFDAFSKGRCNSLKQDLETLKQDLIELKEMKFERRVRERPRF